MNKRPNDPVQKRRQNSAETKRYQDECESRNQHRDSGTCHFQIQQTIFDPSLLGTVDSGHHT